MDIDKVKIIRSSGIRETYTLPEIYDIAFSFRDVASEVDFLCEVAQKHLGRKLTSALELACGPAYHTREMARRRLEADGLDLEPHMAAYARRLIAKDQLQAEIFQGDMKSFRSNRRYDLAYILLVSFAQLESNQDILDHFNCAADLLVDGGILVIETAHPRDFYGDETSIVDKSWTITRGDVTVETNWGGDNQQYDPLTEVDDIVVSFTVTTPQGVIRYEFPDKYRRCSFQTFKALVKLSGRFKIVDIFGAFDTAIPFSTAPQSWRFIPVLQKIG
jgi:SAM-dependent methyltransferase